MLKLLAKLFGAKPAAPAEAEAPYKVEAPAVKEEAPATPVAEKATQAVVESIAPAKKPRAKKPAAPKKPSTRKPKSKA